MSRETLDLPPGLNGDDTEYGAQGRWADGSLVRFRNRRPQVDGGWESLMTTLLTGVCRSVFPWTDNGAVLNIAFGTHSALQVWQGGSLYDITPFGPPTSLPPNPITSSGLALFTVHQIAHGYSTGASIRVFGSTQVGRVSLDGTYTVTSVDADHWRFSAASNATIAKTLASGPLTTLNGDKTITVSEPGHNIADGTVVTFSGATAVGGVTPNGAFSITVIDADHYSYEFTSAATSTATGGGSAVVSTVPTVGGGSSIVLTPQILLPGGAVDGTGSIGIGTGAYGVGPWGETPATADYFPRSWSLSAWGQNLLGSPRNGGMFLWQNDITQRAAAVDNAPVRITYSLVAPMDGGYMAFALGCNQEADGVFNPMCIRHCAIRNLTQWSTLADNSTAREYVLTGGGHIVAGRMLGPYLLVWTSDALWLGTFTAALNQPWNFDRVGRNCGLAGPGAAVVVGQTAYWTSPDRQFYEYQLGGEPSPIVCQIRDEYADNLAAAQADKIIASSNAEYSEIRFDYPDGRDGFENSRFVRLAVNGTDVGAWSKGIQSRTAFVDAGPSLYPVGVTFDGVAYYHEKGHSADGQPFAWRLRTAAQLLDVDWRLLLKTIWPDFQDQQGPITVTVFAREHPQGPDTVYASLPMSKDDPRADLFVSGRIFEIEFSGSSAPTYMRLGKPVIEFERAGKAL